MSRKDVSRTNHLPQSSVRLPKRKRGEVKYLERIYLVTLIFSTFASDIPYNVQTVGTQSLRETQC